MDLRTTDYVLLGLAATLVIAYVLRVVGRRWKTQQERLKKQQEKEEPPMSEKEIFETIKKATEELHQTNIHSLPELPVPKPPKPTEASVEAVITDALRRLREQKALLEKEDERLVAENKRLKQAHEELVGQLESVELKEKKFLAVLQTLSGD